MLISPSPLGVSRAHAYGPPLPASVTHTSASAVLRERERRVAKAVLPDMETQERLLEVYFAYVHPSFPIVDKVGFWEVWRNG